MEDSEKEEIRTRIDLIELIGAYTPLKRAGTRYKGICPFHQEKTPSFTVDPVLGRWHCFGACSEGGDVFKFVMKAEGLTFPEAVERLAARAGVTLSRRGMDKEASARLVNEKDRLYSANTLAARFFSECLRRDSAAQSYVRERGLVQETIERFQIGWAPDDWSPLASFLARQGVRAEDAEKAGLIYPSRVGDGYTDKFRGRLMFPIFDPQERIVAFGGRLIAPRENAPKYLNSPETPIFSKSRVLYALGVPRGPSGEKNGAREAIAQEDRVLVVEGYMDAVACHQAGVKNVVATLGTSLTEQHVDILGRYTKNFVLSFDADAAGERAALRAAETVQKAGPEFALRILVLPPGEDPDSMLRRGDAALFRRALDSAITLADFQIERLKERHALHTETGRSQFLQAAIPLVAAVLSSVERARLIKTLLPFHPLKGIAAEQSLQDEVRRYQPFGPRASDDFLGSNIPTRAPGQGARRYGGYSPRQRGQWGAPPLPTPPPEAGRVKRSAAHVAEEILLRAVLSDEWCRYTIERLGSEPAAKLLSDARAAALVDDLRPLLAGHISPAQAVAALRDEELAAFAAERLLSESEHVEPLSEMLIDGCLETLARRHVKRQNQEILSVQGGDSVPSDEQLRRWAQGARALKKGDDEADAP